MPFAYACECIIPSLVVYIVFLKMVVNTDYMSGNKNDSFHGVILYRFSLDIVDLSTSN